jgi:peroxiredoxin
VLSDPGNRTADAYGLTFTLPDELREVYEQFGIDVPAHNGDDSWRLPMPARFVVDRDGIIRYAKADPDYTVRPEPDETVEFVQRLAD